jgi:putative peptidoglycan lipid II flippase
MIASNFVAWALDTGNTATTGYIFAWGLFAAGVVQYALLTIACRRAAMPLLPRWPRMTPDVKRVIKLSIPGIVSGGVMQINLVVATMIATTIDGAVAYLYYADRLYQLPLGVIGVAIGVVLLPDLSRKLRAGDEAGAINSQNRALELSLLLTLPSAVALMAIPAPIVHTVFEHGAFTRADTIAVVPAVLAFASGLPAFALSKVFQPGFYAREDTSTPMRFALISVLVNVAASLILSRWFGHVGIALATSLAAWVNAGLLGFALSRKSLFLLDDRARSRLPRILVSSLAMGGLLLAGAWLLRSNYAEQAGFIAAAWGLLLLVTGGALSYLVVVHVTGAMRLGEIKTMLKRRGTDTRDRT